MLDEVWRWAGDFRATERTIGISSDQIPMALRELLDDVTAWIDYQTYQPDEIAVRVQRADVAPSHLACVLQGRAAPCKTLGACPSHDLGRAHGRAR
ncbi:MAG: hypothetical protein ABIX28_13240 [Vicinamibacterales bacterium]